MTYQPVRAVTKEDVLVCLNHARALIPLYERENAHNGHCAPVPVESVDQVALDYFERREGIITIGTALHGADVRVYAIDGKLATGGEVEWALPGTARTYDLCNFKESGTVNRFATSLCAILEDRRLHGDKELKSVMLPNNRTARTAHVVAISHR